MTEEEKAVWRAAFGATAASLYGLPGGVENAAWRGNEAASFAVRSLRALKARADWDAGERLMDDREAAP